MPPKCYGYTLDDPALLVAYYREHLAVAFEFGGVFRDDYYYQSLALREQYRGLQSVLQAGDIVLLSSLKDLWKKQNAIEILDGWRQRKVLVVVADCGAMLNSHSPEGRNGQALVRALRAVAGRSQCNTTYAALTDPRYARFARWGVKRMKRRGKSVLVRDRRTRESMALIVTMRDRGASWREITAWMRAHYYTRCGRRWNVMAACTAYKYEMEFRTLEAEMASGPALATPDSA